MKAIIIGFDAFDPTLFEKLNQAGKLPNLGKYAQTGGYARFGITSPPQSEVSWTSIASGVDPGGHGIFDFVHRNPASYVPHPSLLPTQKSAVGTQFIPPHNANTLFQAAVQKGYPATSLWWPATFPARYESPVRSIPGLGTPDIMGRLGVGLLFSTDPAADADKRKTQINPLIPDTEPGLYIGQIKGPVRQTLRGLQGSDTELALATRADGATLTLGKQKIDLPLGQWSEIIELSFKLGFGVKIKAVTRAILSVGEPEPRLYFLPLQIHPLATAWRYASPKNFIKKLWQACGPFLTLGWPQDTTGLEEGCINDQQFLDLCDLVFEERQRVFNYLLADFTEGVLGCVFDTLDRVQHMFWHSHPEVIEEWYIKLDTFLGEVQTKLAARPELKNAKMVVVSDHGFNSYQHKVNLNRWLIEQGYLTPKTDAADGNLRAVDWDKSSAYALGLNSIYLNAEGREGQGNLPAAQQAEHLETLRQKLLAWQGPDGKPVVQHAPTQAEAYHGPLAAYGPDLIVGYAPGYRASAETGLGEWSADAIEANGDHWGADHCFASAAVPGVLFCNQGLGELTDPSYKDFPKLILGKRLKAKKDLAPPVYDEDEDQDVLEERLRDLGYL